MHSSTKLLIERPERWAKQLASHLGHKAVVKTEGNASTVTFAGGGTGRIEAGLDAVLLAVEAANPEQLERIQDILESHLLRFAGLEGIVTLTWSQK